MLVINKTQMLINSLIVLFTFFNAFMVALSNEDKTYQSEAVNCLKLIKLNKNQPGVIKTEIPHLMHQLKSEQKCLELLLSRGLKEEAEVYMLELNKRGIKFTDQLKIATNNIIQRAKSLYNNYRFEESDYVSVYPAFEWAQSLDQVFINIKYSHRWDAPGCVEVKKENIETFENLVMFSAYCIQGDTPIKFVLNLDLFDQIDEKESKFSSSSVGRYQLNLKKKHPGYWRNIVRKGADLPGNMRSWLEMREKYLAEIQKYIDELEEEEFNSIEEEIEILMKKRKKTDL